MSKIILPPSDGHSYVGKDGKPFRDFYNWVVSLSNWARAAQTPTPVNWTPFFTFATPGDLAITYSEQTGQYYKLGFLVFAKFSLQTSAFTYTTASGLLLLGGLPSVTDAGAATVRSGSVEWAGITAAGYTDIVCNLQGNSTAMTFALSGSGKANVDVLASHMPSGGTVGLRGLIIYPTAS